jgi:hypothetical protein
MQQTKQQLIIIMTNTSAYAPGPLALINAIYLLN